MKLIFDIKEKYLLDELCGIQIDSYRVILENHLLKEDELLLINYNSSLEEAEREAKWRISQYKEVMQLPQYLGILEDSEISTLRHILFHMEDAFIQEGYHNEVRSLWAKFFAIEAERSPLLNNIKIVTNEKKKKQQIRGGNLRQVLKGNEGSMGR